MIPTKGMAVNDAVKKILGKAGTKVKLTIQREGDEKPLEFEIIARQVEVETVLGVKRKDERRLGLRDRPGDKIGYIRLTQFAPTARPRHGRGDATS